MSHPVLPTREQIKTALETKLQALQKEQIVPDVITFSGNGEPTIHPDFIGIIRDTCVLRDTYCPKAKVSVLSNSTQLGRKEVVEALKLCDNRILKLDAATDTMMRWIDKPVNEQLEVKTIIRYLAQFEGDFKVIVLFKTGLVLVDSACVVVAVSRVNADSDVIIAVSLWLTAARGAFGNRALHLRRNISL